MTCYEFVGKVGAGEIFLRYFYNLLDTAKAGGLLGCVCVTFEGVQLLEQSAASVSL